MDNMLNVYLFGKKYEVPAGLTIMTAMEYAGYDLVRGCGCRNGFCGACATIYRIKGEIELHGCLACQTEIQEGMYVATLPFFPLEKRIYNIEEIKPTCSSIPRYTAVSAAMPVQRLVLRSLTLCSISHTLREASMTSVQRRALTV